MRTRTPAQAILIAGLLSAALAGCATTGATGTGGVTASQVQTIAVSVCSYLPTANTVANIIAANNPVLVTSEAVAQAICAAVTSKSAKRGVTVPMVSGVPVKGSFVH